MPTPDPEAPPTPQVPPAPVVPPTSEAPAQDMVPGRITAQFGYSRHQNVSKLKIHDRGFEKRPKNI